MREHLSGVPGKTGQAGMAAAVSERLNQLHLGLCLLFFWSWGVFLWIGLAIPYLIMVNSQTLVQNERKRSPSGLSLLNVNFPEV